MNTATDRFTLDELCSLTDTSRRTIRFYIQQEVFKSDVCRGFNCRDVAKVLANAGLLRLDSEGKSTRTVRIPNMSKSPRVFDISSDILSYEENSENVTNEKIGDTSDTGDTNRKPKKNQIESNFLM